MLTPDTALPGRPEPMFVPETHYVSGTPLRGPFPAQMNHVVVAMGYFWGS